MDKKALIITGATGYLGSNLLNHLFESGGLYAYHQIYLLDRHLKIERLEPKLQELIKNPESRIEIAAIDLSNTASFTYVLGKIEEGSSLTCVHAAYLNDLEAEKKLLTALPKSAYLVYFSSSAVYGEADCVNEETQTKPVNDYGKYKLELETLVLEGFEKSLVLRIANPFGNEFEEKGVARNFANKVISNEVLELNQDKSIEAFDLEKLLADYKYSDTDVIRDFVYIEDLIQAISALTKKSAKGIYNLSSGRATALLELVAVLAYRFSKEPKIEYKGACKNAINKSVLDNTKLLSALGLDEIRSVKSFLSKFEELAN